MIRTTAWATALAWPQIRATARPLDDRGKHGGTTELAAGQPGHQGGARAAGGSAVPGWTRGRHVAQYEPRGWRPSVGPGRRSAEPGPRGRASFRGRDRAADDHRDGV